MTAKWSTKSVEQIENMLKTNAACGLSRKAARVRLKKGGENLLYSTESSSVKTYITHLLGDLTSYLLIISAVIAAVFDYTKLAAVIFITWGVNVFLALFTYIKAERTFENASFCSMPKSRVIREGKVYMDDIRNIVRGDILLLRAGDIAPCDVRLINSDSLVVLEYSEDKKQKIRKKNADARIYDEDCTPEQELNMVFAGAVIASGEARAVAVDVGEDTYTFELIGELSLAPSQKLPVFERLGKYCTFWSILMLTLVLPISVIGMKSGLFESFMLGLALASSTMSEMLVAIGRIIVACSVMNAALIGDKNKNNAIIKNISKIEKMPAVDTLLILDDSVFTVGETVVDSAFAENEKRLFSTAMIASGIGFPDTDISTGVHLQNRDNIALSEYASKQGITADEISKSFISCGFVARSEYNFDTALVKDDNGFTAYLKGDASNMLSRCSSFEKNGEDYSMTSEIYARASSFINEAQKNRCRPYIVAKKKSPYNNLSRISSVQNDLTLIGVISFCDPIFEGSEQTLVSLRESGVDVVFASSTDNSAFKTLLSKEGIFKSVYYTDDVGKKRRIFSDLKDSGKTVAVIGSRISDLGIIKDSDVSFTCNPAQFSRRSRETTLDVVPAEKEYGTQAAKKEADVIVKRATTKNYGISSVLCALEYSKTVYRNVENMLGYLLCVLFARMFAVILSVLLGLPLVSASQILFLGLIVDFFAVLIFAFEKTDTKQKNKFSSSVLDRVFKKNLFWIFLGGGLSAITAVLPYVLKLIGFDVSYADISAFSFISLVLSHITVLLEAAERESLFKAKPKLNVIKLISVSLIVLLLMLFIAFSGFGIYLDVCPGSYKTLWFSLVPPVLVLVICEVRKLLVSKKGL